MVGVSGLLMKLMFICMVLRIGKTADFLALKTANAVLSMATVFPKNTYSD